MTEYSDDNNVRKVPFCQEPAIPYSVPKSQTAYDMMMARMQQTIAALSERLERIEASNVDRKQVNEALDAVVPKFKAAFGEVVEPIFGGIEKRIREIEDVAVGWVTQAKRLDKIERTTGMFDNGGTDKTFMRWATERLDALEAWNCEGGVLYNHGTQLGRLEEDRTDFQGRLEAIEEKLSAESDRRWEWLRTYNAVLPECHAQLHGIGDDKVRSDRAHVMASHAADRAHGSLEGKVVGPHVPGYAAAWDAKVAALVKSAQRAHDRLRHETRNTGSVDSHDALAELRVALKPFEGGGNG